METQSIFDWVSFIASLASLILALVAIWTSHQSAKEVRNNFERTQEVMSSYQSKTKEVLAEIDKKSAVIEKTVSESQRELMTTMTRIINETIIPPKRDMGEELGMQFMQTILTNPNQAGSIMQLLEPFMRMAEEQKNNTPKND